MPLCQALYVLMSFVSASVPRWQDKGELIMVWGSEGQKSRVQCCLLSCINLV